MGVHVDRISWRAGLDVVTSITMLVAAGLIIWQIGYRSQESPREPRTRSAPLIPVPVEPVSIEGAELKGSSWPST
jgi:hypothetical protein